MTDIIERAEAALEGHWPGDRLISPARFFGGLVRELAAELKAARAENERLRLAYREQAKNEHNNWGQSWRAK